MNNSAGLAFTPHVLHVGVGEVYIFHHEFLLLSSPAINKLPSLVLINSVLGP